MQNHLDNNHVAYQARQHKIPQNLVFALLLMLLGGNTFGQTSITTKAGLEAILANSSNAAGSYIIEADFNATGYNPTNWNTQAFTGTLTAGTKTDGTFYTISGLDKPLFKIATGANISNIILDEVNISKLYAVGAIADTANGATRIYNCGILSGSVKSTGASTDSPKQANCCGGLVGLLGGTARVVNCFSYANITGGNRVGGIVGYNDASTNSNGINTMVMNCMFYGDITGGYKVSPVYGGNNINNLNSNGLNTFNYYAYSKLKTKSIDFYNCALAVEDKYLNHFELYRLLLNSNKKLAAYYITGSIDDADQVAKWVLETADRSIANPRPYPILKKGGEFYPSIINMDAANAPDSTAVGANKGGKLGRTLSVTISAPSGWTNAPDDVKLLDENGNEITTSRTITLTRTDKDFDRFNFNYDKVQLPYYNDYGTKNYTSNKVVTGWKITEITSVDDDPYTSTNYPDFSSAGIAEYPNYNFADRKSSNKDLYTVSGRIFSQGAYFDVPYGVTSITIEPYWGKAAYVSDQYLDVVYSTGYVAQSVTQLPEYYGADGTSVNINGSNQAVYTSIDSALNILTGVTNPIVYDYAVVLVGNLHQNKVPSIGTIPFTIMSIDEDKDHEPDYSLIYHHKGKEYVSPIRFDFLNIPGTAQAQKPNGASKVCNMGIIKPRGWFEITNTAFIYFSQFEYENLHNLPGGKKDYSPLILQGGIFDQFVSTNSMNVPGYTVYIHVGSNVWIKEFGMGTHSDGNKATPHVPVSVTGGEYQGFYLTGTYNQDAAVSTDNAKCYISGGHFGEAAGAGQEAINGNVRWQIYNADIDNFFGGGANGATGKNIKGDITVDIFNSHVGTYCGGPKFGDMESGKKVTTNAEGCVFEKFFGAGFGGTAYSRKKYYDKENISSNDWTTYANDYISDRGKYFDGETDGLGGGNPPKFGYKGIGVATDLDYEFFVYSSGSTGGRFFVKFASFSLAQCNEVESNLTKCSINGDYYGGGSLGKVTGMATSSLDGCTVNGNVHGAGFSATLPTIQVRDAGFVTNPNYNSSSGLFEPAVLSGTTEFTWKNASEAGVTLTNGVLGSDLTNHYVYTNTDLSSSNLGSVNAVSLTISGHSTVTGNVFGGGEESRVVNNTEVIIKDHAKVLGNVYGGGNKGVVGGNTKVVINGKE